MTDETIELTFSILRKIAKTPREELIMDLVHKEMKVTNVKIYESVDKLDQMQDRVIWEIYAENIFMGSGWVSWEPEGDDTYSSVASTWKLADSWKISNTWVKE